ncbi:LPXTG cell wall anchor domain-containing protein [Actinoplanes sp. NPDC051494]|uniref:LPXTG cell wall anchor domain-containing protein n=1 Tax=Actinoplanes sp. NPDC051494 TaxID=3363907 RepID=UPI0037A3685B
MGSHRFARGAVVIGVLAAMTGFGPVAAYAAPIGTKCKDLPGYSITKPPPARTSLPGLGTGRATDGANGRPYQYNNPGENVRGRAEPTARELSQYGTSTTGKDSGTVPHLYSSWNRYQANKAAELKKWEENPVGKKPSAPLPWDKWLSRYVPNQGNDSRGKAYEKLLVEEIGLGGDDWICQGDLTTNGETRRYDAINGKEKIAYEFKSGRTIDAAQLAKDAQIARSQGYKVVYVFGDKPTAATLRRLNAAGVDYHLMKGTPTVDTTARPNTGPGSKVMNPKPAVPARGAANDMFSGAGKTLDQAREAARVDDDLARQSGKPDQRMRRPGGIDFSTMELRYVAETDGGQGLGYGFEADDVVDEDVEPGFGGLEQAQLASDSLFTWLALQPSAFWVNLNPDTPDQIMDDRFAKTDAGRVLLDADLTLKRSHAKLLDPATPLGDELWDALHFDTPELVPCLPLRIWISAKPASVRDEGEQLYILDAPLKVNAAYMVVQNQPEEYRCRQSEAQAKENVETYQRIILPELEKVVNTDPAYADLRRVYLSRVAAEWLRQRAEQKTTAFTPIINSNDLSRWPARVEWNKLDTYNAYLKSFNEGEFEYTRTVEDGTGQTISVPLVLGGVDFAQAPKAPVSAATFKKDHPKLPVTVTNSVQTPVNYETTLNPDLTWMGGDAMVHKAAAPPPANKPPAEKPPANKPPADKPEPPTGGTGGGEESLPITGASVTGALGVGLALLAGGITLLLWQRKRRRIFRA